MSGRGCAARAGRRGPAARQAAGALRRVHHRVRGAAVAAGAAAGRRPAAVCGWGEEPEWQPGTVVSTTREAEGLRGLRVEVGEALSQGYDKPGQFVQLKVGDSKPAFIAIACPPAEAQAGQLELLIKDGDGTAGLLCGLEAGAAMDVSPVRSVCGRAGRGGGLTVKKKGDGQRVPARQGRRQRRERPVLRHRLRHQPGTLPPRREGGSPGGCGGLTRGAAQRSGP